MADANNLYARLGVERGASADEIRKAYRKEALAKHPDRGGDKEEFQRIQEAYEILSDEGKRVQYDATGVIPGAAEGGGGPGGPGFGGMPDLSQIFSMFGGGMGGIPMPFFGGGMGGNRGPPGQTMRGPNKVHEIGVPLADLYHGKTLKMNMKREVRCEGCKGSGGSKMESCGACGGRGVRMRAQQMGPMTVMSQEPCGECQQTGQRVVTACEACAGKRLVERTASLDIVIEPGMQEGDRIVLAGQCSESTQYEIPGDVILVLRKATTDSPVWMRRDAELLVEVELTLAESLLGWERELEAHPSGRPLHLVWQGGAVRDAEVLRVPEWGMPVRGKSGSFGDLRIVCRVKEAREGWTEEQMRALQSVWPEWRAPVVKDGSTHVMRS